MRINVRQKYEDLSFYTFKIAKKYGIIYEHSKEICKMFKDRLDLHNKIHRTFNNFSINPTYNNLFFKIIYLKIDIVNDILLTYYSNLCNYIFLENKSSYYVLDQNLQNPNPQKYDNTYCILKDIINSLSKKYQEDLAKHKYIIILDKNNEQIDVINLNHNFVFL